LDNVKNEEELTAFETELNDRFGPVVSEVGDLLKTVRLRWEAEVLHFEKLTIKNNTMKGYFVSSPNDNFYQSEKFGKVIDYIQRNARKCSLKDNRGKLILTCNEVKTLDQGYEILKEMTV